jgi:hypothetical protein
LPAIPCLFCDYKDPIEFDLSVHCQEKHGPDLLKLPIGSGCMADRAAHAVELSNQKVMMQTFSEDEEADEQDQ